MASIVAVVILILILLLAGGFYIYRRNQRDTVEELPLPPDYMPIDYTALPQEEEQPQGPSQQARVLIVVGAVLIIGALVAVFYLLGDDSENVAQGSQYELDLQDVALDKIDDKLQLDVTATTSLPVGTAVQARVLESGQPFDLLPAGESSAQVEGSTFLWSIPVKQSFATGSRGITYTFVLEADIHGRTISATYPLEILTGAEVAFYEGVLATPTPRPSPTATATQAPTAAAEPTAEPEPEPEPTPGPVTVLTQRATTVYRSPFGPTGIQGQLSASEQVLVVAKLWSSEWYLVAAPSSSGWVEGAALDLGGATVPVSGASGSSAAVFNGGNIRTAPVSGQVVGQLHAGQTVKLQGRTADSAWFNVKAPGGSGWVSATLLTIDPAVVTTVPVQ